MSGSYNILVLDDDKTRLSMFKRGLIGNAVNTVSTADDAISMLKLYKYAIVFMDYDLDLEQSLNAEVTGNGMDVVDWILKNKASLGRTHFIIHSLNSHYGPVMYTTLKTAGFPVEYRPGAWNDTAFLSSL